MLPGCFVFFGCVVAIFLHVVLHESTASFRTTRTSNLNPNFNPTTESASKSAGSSSKFIDVVEEIDAPLTDEDRQRESMLDVFRRRLYEDIEAQMNPKDCRSR
jgi:hypothetical protein